MDLKHTVMLGCGQDLSLSFLRPSKIQSKRVLVYERERETGRKGAGKLVGLGLMKLHMGSDLQAAAPRGCSKTLRKLSPS